MIEITIRMLVFSLYIVKNYICRDRMLAMLKNVSLYQQCPYYNFKEKNYLELLSYSCRECPMYIHIMCKEDVLT